MDELEKARLRELLKKKKGLGGLFGSNNAISAQSALAIHNLDNNINQTIPEPLPLPIEYSPQFYGSGPKPGSVILNKQTGLRGSKEDLAKLLKAIEERKRRGIK